MKPCETCGEPMKNRRFCSVKCRANHPEFLAIATANAQKAQAARRGTASKRDCEHCGKAFECQPKRATRFCSRPCYFGHLAAIFDSTIEFDVDRITNFDEYLSNDLLKCPVGGCSWEGEDLGLHVTQRHGISAERFKSEAGFNRSTALVGAALYRRLQQRNRVIKPLVVRGTGPSKGHGILREEGQQRYEKAMALRRTK